jgi:Flp pilus assembly protein TadD
MKMLKSIIATSGLALCIALSSCGKVNDTEKGSEGSGSATETTPNDSSGAESRKAVGVGEDNQDDSLGYPSNQSNLNADSTSRKHD